MRIFALNRLSYIDELGNDPEVSKIIESIDVSNRFIGEIDNEDRMWIPEMIAKIPELEISKDNSFIVPSKDNIKQAIVWARIDPPAGISYMRNASSLCTERSRSSTAFWDTKTKRILFIHNMFVHKFTDEAFKEKFFMALAEALDSKSRDIKL